MFIWILIAIVIAFVAYQRASRAERIALEQKKDLEQLRAWLQAWYEKGTAAQAQAAQAAAAQPAGASEGTHAGAVEAAAAAAAVEGATSSEARRGVVWIPTQSLAPGAEAANASGISAADAAAAAASGQTPESLAAAAAYSDSAEAAGVPPSQAAAAASRATGAAAGDAGWPSDTIKLTPEAAAAAGLHVPDAGAAGAAAPHTAAASAATAAARVDASADDTDALENRIGGRWLLYIGLAALVLGASYFVKYAFDNDWINPPLRIGIGVLGGLALIVAGQRFVARGLVFYGQALSGGGIGVLYLAIYAAYRWYELITQPVASAAMILTTIAGVWLADRQRSQALAMLAIIVGFATPFLIGDTPGSQVVLFTYDAILVAGTLALARRRAWPALNLVSYVLTLMTFASWFEVGYKPREYLVTELFLTLFLALFLYMWRETQRYESIERDASAPESASASAAQEQTAPRTPVAVAVPAIATPADALAQMASVLLSLVPLPYHLASLYVLFPQRGALLVYLIAFSTAGVIAARRMSLPWLRGLTWIGVAVPFLWFVRIPLPSGWVTAAWISLFAIYGLHMVAQVDRVQDEEPDRRLPGLEVFLLHANGIWLMLAAHALMAPRILGLAPRVTLALSIWYGLLTLAARAWRTDVALHTATLALTFAAGAAALYFDAPWLSVALALDGAALVWLALRANSQWMRAWGTVILALGVLRVLYLLAEPSPVSYLPIANPHALAGLFVVGVLYALARLHPRRPSTPSLPSARDTLIIAANLLTLVVLSTEINAFFNRRAWTTGLAGGAAAAGAESDAELSRQLSLSIAWAVYAVGLVFIGIRRRYRPIRYLAIIVLGFTILKVFTVDIATLDRVSKMLSVMALGVLLLIASYLYQRVSADLSRKPSSSSPPPPLPSASPSPSPTPDTSLSEAAPDEH